MNQNYNKRWSSAYNQECHIIITLENFQFQILLIILDKKNSSYFYLRKFDEGFPYYCHQGLTSNRDKFGLKDELLYHTWFLHLFDGLILAPNPLNFSK